MWYKKLPLFILVSVISIQAQKKLVADKSKSNIKYAMSHPMHDWTAISKDINSAIVLEPTNNKIVQVATVVKVSSFDSGNANRDSHAIEVLDALKYAKVTFSSTKIEDNGNHVIAFGNLNFHGIIKPIKLIANKDDTSKFIHLTGDFSIKMTDYLVERPSLLGVKAADEIKFSFDLSFNK